MCERSSGDRARAVAQAGYSAIQLVCGWATRSNETTARAARYIYRRIRPLRRGPVFRPFGGGLIEARSRIGSRARPPSVSAPSGAASLEAGSPTAATRWSSMSTRSDKLSRLPARDSTLRRRRRPFWRVPTHWTSVERCPLCWKHGNLLSKRRARSSASQLRASSLDPRSLGLVALLWPQTRQGHQPPTGGEFGPRGRARGRTRGGSRGRTRR